MRESNRAFGSTGGFLRPGDLVESPNPDMSLQDAILTRARQAFLVTYNSHTDNLPYLDHVQSAAAFITTFGLVAHSAGVGTCWIGHLPNKGEMRRIFDIHPRFEPLALVTFGFYREKVKTRPCKRSARQVIFKGRFAREELQFSTSEIHD